MTDGSQWEVSPSMRGACSGQEPKKTTERAATAAITTNRIAL